jgi:hypothetical protein
MSVKQLVAVIAVLTAAGRVFAEPIDLDPYIPPTVRTDIVRAQLEKAHAQELRDAGNPRAQGGQTGPVKKQSEAHNDSLPTAKSSRLK